MNSPTSPGKGSSGAIKKSFWGVAAFYMLIAFEFLYMASPFAVYFYSVYRPALNVMNDSPVLGWLISYFMPHIVVETASPLVNIHNVVGGALAVVGFLGFVVGACQVYSYKLLRKGAVTGGIYNYIRHPQYASFILCSFGLLILWPRYIVLVMFITMLFGYYLLARVEERECEAKFGQVYADYKRKTGMFLPIPLPRLPELSGTALGKAGLLFGMYAVTLALGLMLAWGVNTYVLNSLYGAYTKDSASISASRIDREKLERVLEIAASGQGVQAKLEQALQQPDVRLLNYVLPSEWYIAEIPLNGVGPNGYHRFPGDYDPNLYKVVYTAAEIRGGDGVSGKDIIQRVKTRTPLVEVWVDVRKGTVVKQLDPPREIMYRNIPVAVY